jgi:hypothetical protein
VLYQMDADPSSPGFGFIAPIPGWPADSSRVR